MIIAIIKIGFGHRKRARQKSADIHRASLSKKNAARVE